MPTLHAQASCASGVATGLYRFPHPRLRPCCASPAGCQRPRRLLHMFAVMNARECLFTALWWIAGSLPLPGVMGSRSTCLLSLFAHAGDSPPQTFCLQRRLLPLFSAVRRSRRTSVYHHEAPRPGACRRHRYVCAVRMSHSPICRCSRATDPLALLAFTVRQLPQCDGSPVFAAPGNFQAAAFYYLFYSRAGGAGALVRRLRFRWRDFASCCRLVISTARSCRRARSLPLQRAYCLRRWPTRFSSAPTCKRADRSPTCVSGGDSVLERRSRVYFPRRRKNCRDPGGSGIAWRRAPESPAAAATGCCWRGDVS